MSHTKTSHFIVIPFAASWSHLRSILHTSVNLIILHHNLHITILLTPSTLSLVEAELHSPSFRHLLDHDSSNKAIIDRVQLVTVASQTLRTEDAKGFNDGVSEGEDYAKVLPKFLEPLFAPEKEAGFENKFKELPPSCVMFDPFQFFVPELVTSLLSSLSIPMVPILVFGPSTALAWFHHYAAKEHGGFLDAWKALQMEEVAKGADPLEAIDKLYFHESGQVKHLPGLPPMYDYEFVGMNGTWDFPVDVKQMCIDSRQTVLHPSIKGFMIPFPAELEPEAVEAFQKEIPYPLMMAGLQFPDSVWRREKTARPTEGPHKQAMDFLDDMRNKHGKHSVVYLSLGSLFWPIQRPEIMVCLIESLIEHKFPVLFAHASPFADIPAELQAKMDANEDFHVVKTSPQWQVLEHDSIKFFISHCGLSSLSEAIMNEVPIVSIPFLADQSEISAFMRCKTKAVIELIQVKTVKNRPTMKLYGRPDVIGTEEAIRVEMAEVWGRMNGKEGEEMRDNMKKVRKICMDSWEHGEGRKVMTEGIAKFF